MEGFVYGIMIYLLVYMMLIGCMPRRFLYPAFAAIMCLQGGSASRIWSKDSATC